MTKAQAFILIADGDLLGRYLLAQFLRDAQFRVQEAATGREALFLARDKPDLVVLGMNLPDMTSAEVCQRLKADRTTAAIPVLQLVASIPAPEAGTEGRRSGADGSLTRRPEPSRLVAQIKMFLARQASRRPASEAWAPLLLVRRRILLIEDNREVAASLSLLLRLLGYDVQVAYTGRDGVNIALGWQPDLVLSDLGLPGELDGYAVARALRRHPETARTRLIAVTCYGEEEDRRRSQEAGFEYHLVKPVDPDALQVLLASPQLA
ncbi:MAG: response regulator [Gemmataceae bacterium]|nr:response regulator [Gemmataceae bacterium]